MNYKFDLYGWFSGTSDAKTSRSTTVVPANLSLTETPGELRANFTGYVWQDLAYTTPSVIPEPPAHVPEAVTMRQARLALLGAGVLATADAAIAGMPGIEGDAARIEWGYAHEVRRDAPLVAGMAAVLGLTEEQLDSLFVTAASL